MHSCLAQRSHSHQKIMDILRTLESGSLSFTAMLDFSGKNGSDWERDLHLKVQKSRNFWMTLPQLSWACDVVGELLLILINIYRPD